MESDSQHTLPFLDAAPTGEGVTAPLLNSPKSTASCEGQTSLAQQPERCNNCFKKTINLKERKDGQWWCRSCRLVSKARKIHLERINKSDEAFREFTQADITDVHINLNNPYKHNSIIIHTDVHDSSFVSSFIVEDGKLIEVNHHWTE